MTRAPVFAPAFVADLRRLDKRDQTRILDAIERWAQSGHGDVRQLRGRKFEWRLRVGKWRAFYHNTPPHRPIFFGVDNRGEAY